MSAHTLTRRGFLAGSAVLLDLALCGFSLPARKFRKFILVTVDTLRADHLGCYGYPLATSPAIDAFAAKSVLFEKAYAASSCTCPSLMAMHTSRYPGMSPNLLSNGPRAVAPDTPVLAGLLKKKGLTTGAIVGNFNLRPAGGLSGGFDTYEALLDSREQNRDLRERICTSLTPAASSWLAENAGRDFFLWLHYQDPHGPYTPPEPYLAKFASDTSQEKQVRLLENNRGKGGIPKYQVLEGLDRLGSYKSRYDGEIAFFDDSFAALMAQVSRLGLDDDCVVIFASDHGEAFGERDYFCCHGHNVHPELAHVPLMMRIPSAAPAKVSAPVNLVDVAPTILELAGVERPGAFMGHSLLPTTGGAERPDAFFIETSYEIAAVEGNWYFTWGASKWSNGNPENLKVSDAEGIGFYDAPMALYDLSKDPSCTTDVSAENARWTRYLRGCCQDYLRKSAPYAKKQAAPEMDSETRKALETLGYLDN